MTFCSMKPRLFLMVQMICVAFLPVGSSPVFGAVPYTIAGYDVDNGTEPICWTYPLQYNYSGNTEVSGRVFQMMPLCYPRTSMKITVDDLDLLNSVQTLYTQWKYTVNLEISIDFESIEQYAPAYFDDDYNINSSYTVEGNRYYSPNQVLFRIALCDVTKIGFCNPVALDFLEFTDNLTEYNWEAIEELWVTDGEIVAPYEEGTVLKGVNLGNHIYSRWIMLELDPVDAEGKLFYTNETLIIQIPESNAGTFFVVGHGHLELQLNETNNNSGDSGIYLEVASAIPDNVVSVKPPPTILKSSTAMKVAVGLASGICAVGTLLTLVFIVYHRGHAVMKLSQWGMLTWLVSCAMISFAFMFTYLPTHEWHCRFNEFFELIPMTMIGAILVGRVWRIYVTLSPAMSIGKEKKKGQTVAKIVIGTLTQIARFPYGCRELGQENEGFRAKATAAETIRLVLVLCVPQLVVQIVGVAVYDKILDYDFDIDGSTAIVICSDEGIWVRRVGVMLMWLVYTLALILAWVGRDLPAAFNDTDAIFQSSSINAIVSLIAITLDMLTTAVRTAPDVTAFIWVSTSMVISLTAVCFITVPKIKRVLSGEKVIISDLLKQARTSEHSTSHPGGGETSILQSGKSLACSRLPNGERPTIHVKRNDPIPRKLERELLGVNEMVEGIRNELIEGRTPDLSEWKELIGKVEELNEDLHRTQFDWTVEDETAT